MFDLAAALLLYLFHQSRIFLTLFNVSYKELLYTTGGSQDQLYEPSTVNLSIDPLGAMGIDSSINTRVNEPVPLCNVVIIQYTVAQSKELFYKF